MPVATHIFLFLALASVLAVNAAATPLKNKVIEIKLIMREDGAHAYFDPVGVHIQPGDTVRWAQIRDYHSVTAYHPTNSNHELRIRTEQNRGIPTFCSVNIQPRDRPTSTALPLRGCTTSFASPTKPPAC